MIKSINESVTRLPRDRGVDGWVGKPKVELGRADNILDQERPGDPDGLDQERMLNLHDLDPRDGAGSQRRGLRAKIVEEAVFD